MLIEETFTVHAPVATVADFFLDIDRVSRCVPGVGDVRAVGDDAYEATLSVRVGPVAAAFTGSITLDRSEAPKRLKASGQGKDRASGSRVEVKFTADLVDVDPTTTEVRTQADVVVRGRLGQFGTGVIKATSRELVKTFSACANEALTTPVAKSADVAATPATEASSPVESQPPSAPSLDLLPLVGRLLLALVAGVVKQLARLARALVKQIRR